MSDDLKDRFVNERLGGLMAGVSERLPDLDRVPLPSPRGRHPEKIHFEEIKRQLAAHVGAIAVHYLPSGKRVGKHWSTGDIDNTPPEQDDGSFKLNLDGEHAGNWHDFNTREHGDLLDLIQRREGHSNPRDTIAFCEAQGWLTALPKTRIANTTTTKDILKRREKARKLWERSHLVEGTIGETYLRGRGLPPPYGPHLRFHPEGTSGHPSLVAAFVMPETGEITAVQTTALMADGSGKAGIKPPRRTIGPPEGASIVVQAHPTATEIIMAEGVETALSLCASAPDAEIVAYGPKNNLVNASVDPRFKRVTIAADQDAPKADQDAPKEVEKLADKLRYTGKQVRVIFPATADANVRKGYDFNDLLREKGAEAVKERLSHQTPSDPASAQEQRIVTYGRFRARPFSKFPDSSSVKYLVKDLLPAQGMFGLFSASGKGKSFVLVDLAVAIASGQNFAGRKTQNGVVVVLAGEGEYGLKNRLTAASAERGCPNALERIWSVESPFEFLRDGSELNEMLREIQSNAGEPIRLVVVDTLAQTFGDGDPDKTSDMQRYVKGLKEMTKGFQDILVGVAHHTGWNETRERNSNALRAASDVMIQLENKDNLLTLTPIKNLRDGKPWEPFSLELVETCLPDGNSTLTVKHLPGALGSRNARKPGPKTGKLQTQICDLLRNAPLGLTRDQLKDGLPSGQSRDSLRQTLKKLVKAGSVGLDGDLYSLKDA